MTSHDLFDVLVSDGPFKDLSSYVCISHVKTIKYLNLKPYTT